MNIDVHKASLEEKETLAQILQDSADFKQSIGDNSWESRVFGGDEVSEIIDRGFTFIAVIDAVAAATITLEWSDERIWGVELGSDQQAVYVHKLAVRREYRGRGVGEYLLRWAEGQANKNGRQYLRLDCSGSNEGLCEYYKRLGFGIVGPGVQIGDYDPVLFQNLD